MIRTLTTLTCVLLDRLETIEARAENFRLARGCAGGACAVCAFLDDIVVPRRAQSKPTATAAPGSLDREHSVRGTVPSDALTTVSRSGT
jgi:hypothetical protein